MLVEEERRLPGPYFWDVMFVELGEVFDGVWGKRIPDITARQHVGMFFSSRTLRRAASLTVLFRDGLYVEAHPLVRAAYEDWVTLAHLLQGKGDSRVTEFWEDVYKLDARVHDAFQELCGPEATRDLYPNVPPQVARHIGKDAKSTKLTYGPDIQARADSVGLRGLHRFAYAYLSAFSHSGPRNFGDLFELRQEASGRVHVPRRPGREDKKEYRLAAWYAWFWLRTMTLGARELGVDLEHLSDALLAERAENLNLETCVFVRERTA